MIICNGNKIHDLDYDVTRHWIHLKVCRQSRKTYLSVVLMYFLYFHFCVFPNTCVMRFLSHFSSNLFHNWPINITYLVSSRPYIEICRVCKIYGRRGGAICRVCKIYGRRGGAEPSIYFTNPTYFYVRSGTDQISVLFRRGPLFVYTALHKIRKSVCTADNHRERAIIMLYNFCPIPFLIMKNTCYSNWPS